MARHLYEQVEAGVGIAVEKQVAQKAGPATRMLVETLFALPIVYILFLLGRSFFYDAPWLGRPLLGLDFLAYAILWVLVWAAFLRWMLMRRLRGGLKREITRLVDDLLPEKIVGELYADLEDACGNVEQQFERLQTIGAEVRQLKHRFGRIEGVEVGTLEQP